MPARGTRNTGVRVLVAFEDDYRAYREVIAAGLRIHHDQYEVATSTVEALAEQIERFCPDVVIGGGAEDGGAEDAEVAGVLCWIELTVVPTELTKVRLGECRWEMTNPQLETLVGIIEKADQAQSAVNPKPTRARPRLPMPTDEVRAPSSSVPSPARTSNTRSLREP
jgi:hypothetical protein